MTDEPARGIVVLCSPAGEVREVVSNRFPDARPLEPGMRLAEWVEHDSREKLTLFISEAVARGSIFGWEMNIMRAGRAASLHFSAAVKDEHLLVVGAENRIDILKIYDELMRMNHDQINMVRSAIKEQTRLAQELNLQDISMYDQMSRLNNELIDLQRDLTKKNFQLEVLNRQKNQFLGMAAHDLRSPLSAIISYGGFLQEDIAHLLSDEHKEFLNIIISSSYYMRGLIDDLLDVSAIEAGQLTLHCEPTRLDDLTRRCVRRHQALAGRHDLSVVCEENLPPVSADPGKIEQVINNLLSNTLKYSPLDSAVEVSVRSEQSLIVISVRDHGQGIPPQEMDNLFKPFGKTSARSVSGERSTGLGLAISHRIIQGHGGQIWAVSELGAGSTFSFSLPIDNGKR